MNTRCFLLRAIALIVMPVLAAGCATTAVLPAGKDAEWTVVVIGDSSMWEHGKAIASQIETDLGVKVVVEDFALSGLRASAVREVFETGKSVNMRLERLPEAVREAEVVVMFANPSGSVDPAKPFSPDGCFSSFQPGDCSMDTLNVYISDLETIWRNMIELREGKATILVATDLYNPLVANWHAAGTFDSCDVCWTHMSTATRLAAEAYHIPFISRYDTFNGPDHRSDPVANGYIQADGEHPSARMAAEFAQRLADLGYQPYKAQK